MNRQSAIGTHAEHRTSTWSGIALRWVSLVTLTFALLLKAGAASASSLIDQPIQDVRAANALIAEQFAVAFAESTASSAVPNTPLIYVDKVIVDCPSSIGDYAQPANAITQQGSNLNDGLSSTGGDYQQWIFDRPYAWRVNDLGDGTACITLLLPLHGELSLANATLLLRASQARFIPWIAKEHGGSESQRPKLASQGEPSIPLPPGQVFARVTPIELEGTRNDSVVNGGYTSGVWDDDRIEVAPPANRGSAFDLVSLVRLRDASDVRTGVPIGSAIQISPYAWLTSAHVAFDGNTAASGLDLVAGGYSASDLDSLNLVYLVTPWVVLKRSQWPNAPIADIAAVFSSEAIAPPSGIYPILRYTTQAPLSNQYIGFFAGAVSAGYPAMVRGQRNNPRRMYKDAFFGWFITPWDQPGAGIYNTTGGVSTGGQSGSGLWQNLPSGANLWGVIKGGELYGPIPGGSITDFASAVPLGLGNRSFVETAVAWVPPFTWNLFGLRNGLLLDLSTYTQFRADAGADTANLVWRSNVDGVFGTGGSFPSAGKLRTGVHNLTISVGGSKEAPKAAADEAAKTGPAFRSLNIVVAGPSGRIMLPGLTSPQARCYVDLVSGQCSLDLAWTSEGGSQAAIYRRLGSAEPTLVANGRTGSRSLSLGVGEYVFELFNDTARAVLIDRKSVSVRVPSGSLSLSPSAFCELDPNLTGTRNTCQSTISWTTEGAPNAGVFARANNVVTSLFGGGSGNRAANFTLWSDYSLELRQGSNEGSGLIVPAVGFRAWRWADDAEPDSGFGRARALPNGTYYGRNIHTSSDQDWIRFETGGGAGRIIVDVEREGSESTVTLRIDIFELRESVNSAGEPVESLGSLVASKQASTSERGVSLSILTDQSNVQAYVARISSVGSSCGRPPSGRWDCNSTRYTLRANYLPGADALEPNDTPAPFAWCGGQTGSNGGGSLPVDLLGLFVRYTLNFHRSDDIDWIPLSRAQYHIRVSLTATGVNASPVGRIFQYNCATGQIGAEVAGLTGNGVPIELAPGSYRMAVVQGGNSAIGDTTEYRLEYVATVGPN